MNYGVLNKHSFVLPEGKVQIKSGYLKVNDDIDVLNIKEKELGSNLSRFGGIGDMSGFDFEVRYGITSRDTIFVNYQRWDVEHSDTTLRNDKIELFNRYNLLSYEHGIINSLSFDLGYSRDSSSPLSIKNESLLNSMIKKISPSSSISLKDGSIVADGTTLSIYDENNNKIHPYLSIEDLSSQSYYARVLLGKKFSDYFMFDVYFGYKITDIKTKITFKPDNIKTLNSLASRYTKNLDRDEKSANAGFAYMGVFGKNLIEFDYEYTKIFRDESVSNIDYSHTIEGTISRYLSENFLLYVGGKIMLQQFNTDIPYLYNQYTSTQFDKKYGFAQIGVIFSF